MKGHIIGQPQFASGVKNQTTRVLSVPWHKTYLIRTGAKKVPPPYLIRTGAKEVPRQSHAAIPGNWETIHPGHAMHGMQESAIMVRSANFTMCAQSRAVEELTERMNAASAAKMSAGKGDEHHQLGHTVCHLANPRDSSSVTKQQVNC